MVDALVDNNSGKQDQLIDVFNGGSPFIMQEWQRVWNTSVMKNALDVIRRIAILGNVNAFKFMKTKIGMPDVKVIAKDPAVIETSKAYPLTGPIAGIVNPDGDWEGFLRAKGIIE